MQHKKSYEIEQKIHISQFKKLKYVSNAISFDKSIKRVQLSA